ncbi:MAG: sigma-54-dependent Fis family transcriptional regulator [Acidobacteria bacterium]|nr:MAG: sigma-54-dependent Fis family transcriptional regulator [Acidobacteriota bacterium]REK07368.1 MAG: sigma-54-dependent Fis family transcriptional regulator [Acidobacteriota bacterium]
MPADAARSVVLVVDDESYVRDSLESLLSRRGFEVRTADGVDAALEDAALAGVDVVLSDLKMPGRDGLELVRELAEEGPPVVMMTGHGTVRSAVECLQAGAADYVLKPTDPDDLVITLERCMATARSERELRYLRSRASGAEDGADELDPLGEAPAWRAAVELALRAAETDAPILLQGETGTGKEEVARLVHRRSGRKAQPFVAVNCAALPPELFESEFFGHRRGAFTGAVEANDGRLRVADGGTIFLDEINSLPPANQAKVLRVVEDGSFERVGESRPSRVDVRWICAANSDLEADVAAGRFRADLLYRINLVTVELPPLRERREDVELLALHFLRRAARQLGRPVTGLGEGTLEELLAHGWPGNVRELRNVIERGVLLENGELLTVQSLPPLSKVAPRGARAAAESEAHADTLNLSEVKAAAERRALREALRRSGGVRKAAAELLGVDDRNLSYYLKKHDLQDYRGGS